MDRSRISEAHKLDYELSQMENRIDSVKQINDMASIINLIQAFDQKRLDAIRQETLFQAEMYRRELEKQLREM